MKKLPIIGITMGDAAGIGPEVSIKVLAKEEVYRICKPLIIGNRNILQKIIEDNKYRLCINTIKNIKEAKFAMGIIDVLDFKNIDFNKLKIGQVDKMCGKASVEYIEKAVQLIKNKKLDAIVTAPICKESIYKAGLRYGGHTELLAHLAKTDKVIMMIAGSTLRTVLVTRHLPINKVSSNLSIQKIIQVIEITNKSMKELFRISNPKIIVCSLNPHCGEGGILGTEEQRIITPAVNEVIKKGIDVTGPVSPDKAIYEAASGRFDVVVVMYHDQSLIPVKLLAFNRSVNVTLGLPFVRTSPCHGTAFDIAGKGIADPDSMFEALKLASKMVLRE